MSESGDLHPGHQELVARFRAGDRAALARAISLVEDEARGFEVLLHAVLRGQAAGARPRVGITGPPGAGKSTLLGALAATYSAEGKRVGVVAVDPTSPFSGGALLGDRIRMVELTTAPGVFIRSMASRNALGGLATTTREVVDLLDAFGFDRVLVETVGVGQTDLGIAEATDTVVVVLVPESGDAVQALKAGLMEIADLFVVNKADRPGADRIVRELRQAIELRSEASSWPIPVLRTTASSGEGLPELVEALDRHASWLRESGELEGRILRRARSRIREVVEREIKRRVWRDDTALDLLDAGVREVAAGRETPYGVARRIASRCAAEQAPEKEST